LVRGTNPVLQVAIAVPGHINTMCRSSTGLDTVAEILRTTDNAKIVIESVDTALDNEVSRRGAEDRSVINIAGWA
jgi:tRNA G18 (ribose-2'-O)-methylase SpoU